MCTGVKCVTVVYSIRAGAACVSTILLAFGLIGLLVVPYLPYSSNPMPYNLVMAYMLLMSVAFCISLCGALTDLKWMVIIGFVLALLSFAVWLLLTIPSLSDDFPTDNICLGPSCGESHWLVPRRYKQRTKDQKNGNDSSGRDNYMRAADVVLGPIEYYAEDSDVVPHPTDDYAEDRAGLLDRDSSGTTLQTTPMSEDEELLQLAQRILDGDAGERVGRMLNVESTSNKKMRKRQVNDPYDRNKLRTRQVAQSIVSGNQFELSERIHSLRSAQSIGKGQVNVSGGRNDMRKRQVDDVISRIRHYKTLSLRAQNQTTSKPEPTSSKPKPTSSKPEPTSSKTEPTSSKPKSTSSKPTSKRFLDMCCIHLPLIALNRTNTIMLAGVYALLYLFTLATLCLNVASFWCKSKPVCCDEPCMPECCMPECCTPQGDYMPPDRSVRWDC